MADATFTSPLLPGGAQKFPDGTVVRALPVGRSDEPKYATVASGKATFTGLFSEYDYLVRATVNGVQLEERLDNDSFYLSVGSSVVSPSTKIFVGKDSDISPLIAALSPGTEYVWTETDGQGVEINDWAGVA